jgi:hypothetical protein
MDRAEGLSGGSFIWPQAVSASEIAISSSLSFSELGGKHKKRYFGIDLCRVAHEHIHRRYRAFVRTKKHSDSCDFLIQFFISLDTHGTLFCARTFSLHFDELTLTKEKTHGNIVYVSCASLLI